MSVFDHPKISERYFFPRSESPPDPTRVKSGEYSLNCYHRRLDKGAPTILFFHGNGEVVADYLPAWADLFEKLGANSFFCEYRGYGGSTGEPKLTSMMDDLDPLFEACDSSPEKTIVFGRSIGSIYAIELAFRHQCAGLVIESGISSVLERILLRVRPDEIGTTMRDMEMEAQKYFDHHTKLASFEGALLVLHAVKDSLVSLSHAHSNFRAASTERKKIVEFPRGDHNSVFWDNRDAYVEALEDFIRDLT